MSNNEYLAHTRLQNISRALAHEAADALEPDAGQPIDDAARERLAVALQAALMANIPPLPNLVQA
ncbi:hypothetical protein [Burkholderia multivorans]|nr:hypothetical protein [Burkholderia multivorans]MDR8853747.1 hypothetical protein [Burkholderia pseudomultivorans]MCO1361311.1 hypothetical protein [Burkholderia multivorans]MCO1421081.1 hypothetical protein [Burkholderia multivorans]MDR9053452.1 hypothetical protein [Burkholderia multivorans]MDR9059252.1 hypothetical protein [Burkholderia multivorans]